MVHHTVIKRIQEVVDYRPKALKGIARRCWQEDGETIEFTGIVDHIDNS